MVKSVLHQLEADTEERSKIHSMKRTVKCHEEEKSKKGDRVGREGEEGL